MKSEEIILINLINSSEYPQLVYELLEKLNLTQIRVICQQQLKKDSELK
jgi:hypothetical protein